MKASFKGGLRTMTPNLHAKDRKNFLALATALVSTIFVLPFKAYARKVLGRDLMLYQALVVFKSGSAHACAILNSWRWKDLHHRPSGPLPWSSEGGIEYLELWSVVGGRAVLVAKGSIEDVARALSSAS
jgi:hypothetical protein